MHDDWFFKFDTLSLHAGQAAFYGTAGVRSRSAGPWVALIHGAGCDHSVWALQARHLARKGCRVIAVDLPRHGASGGQRIASIEGFVDWLDSFFQALPIHTPLTLAGHSMGASIAAAYAAKFPERAARVVLISAGDKMPVNPELLADTLARPERARAFIAAFGHGHAMRLRGAATPGSWNLGATLALLERCEPETLHADFQACRQWRAAELAENIRCPVLVIAGTTDRMTPPRTAQALAAALPNAKLEWIDGAGHFILAETPDRISRLLASFILSEETG